MKLERAVSGLEIKAVDEERRIITGIATTPTTDRMGDIVEPKGAEFKLPIPFLWQHDSHSPIGQVTKAKVTAAGIEVEIQLAQTEEPGELKNLLDKAWQSIKLQLVKGLSIGFSSIESADIDGSWGRRFTKWLWLELSAVTIAANGDASIQTIKAIDQQTRAALGHTGTGVVRLGPPPGASGKTSKTIQLPKPLEGNNMNVQEELKRWRAARAEKAARMEQILEKSAATGETLNEADDQEFETLKGEVATIDKQIGRLVDHEKAMVASGAVAVPGAGTVVSNVVDQGQAAAASAARGGISAVSLEKPLEKGVGFARYAGIMAAAKGSISDALVMAKEIFPEEKMLHSMVQNHNRILKAPVDVGTTLDTDYAAPLVYARNLASEFIEYLRPQTIVGKITGLRRVPFNIRVPRQLTGGSAGWVGEGAPKPLTQIALDTVALKYKKLATIAVISDELARFSEPSAELIIRDTLAGAIIQQMDSDFINPANAGTTDVKPASITNGVAAVVSQGGTEADVICDIKAIFAPFIAANLTPANGVWIMSATTALSLSLMMNALGQRSFPGITMDGGTFNGMPVIVSEAVGNIIVLANASDILLADDGQVTIDTSREASLQMDSEPTNPPVAATVFISLWQMNLLGIKAERTIDWIKARPASVQYLSGVDYGDCGT